MADPLQRLLDVLGKSWVAIIDHGGWQLCKGDHVYVSAWSRNQLFRKFATPDDVFDEIDRRTFRIPEFLRCLSPEELAVKLEVLDVPEEDSKP